MNLDEFDAFIEAGGHWHWTAEWREDSEGTARQLTVPCSETCEVESGSITHTPEVPPLWWQKLCD